MTPPSQLRRVLLSSYLGSTVEFYDFLVYGTAASLVFGPLFFTNLSPIVGTIMSLGTLAVGYVARPLGGAIFGHFGDRLGRKRMLVLTMVLMGLASTGIGLVPTRETIGLAAPLLLVVLRLIQGLAIGGEWGGATLMALEHSQTRRRGLAVGIVNAGAPTGAVLAAAIMGLFSLLDDAAFLTWGWRVPFLISAVLVAVALWVRLGVSESPIFQEAEPVSRPPIVEILSRPKTVLVATAAGIAPLAIQSLLATFALTFAVAGGASNSTALFAMALASVLNMISLPIFAALSDRVGRRPVLLAGLGLGLLLGYPIFAMIGSGSVVGVFAGYFLGYGLLVGMMIGTLSAFVSEQFPTTARYTGASLGYQLAATIGAGFAPMIAAELLHRAGTHTAWPVAIFIAVLALLSAVAVASTVEPARRELAHAH